MRDQIRNLIDCLNQHTKAYDEGNPTISDKEWDELFFQLQSLEEKSHIIFPDSPTQSISYKVMNQLEKVEHSHKMLSLEKTKDLNVVNSFAKGQDILAMCKLDGLTCSLRYENGKLVKAETRGNGLIGENILHNALVISSIPSQINHKGILVVDGEIICDYENFKKFEDEVQIDLRSFIDMKKALEYADMGILVIDDNGIMLTDKGFLIMDKVILDLV
jgi:DNA ligase (NAD+)